MKSLRIAVFVAVTLLTSTGVFLCAVIVFIWNPLNQINFRDMRGGEALLAWASNTMIVVGAIAVATAVILGLGGFCFGRADYDSPSLQHEHTCQDQPENRNQLASPQRQRRSGATSSA